MDSFFTVGYVIKLLLGAAAFLLIRKLIRKFIVKKINADTEIQLLIYLYKNRTILDFDNDVDTFYSDFMHKFYINNAMYHVEIRIDENDIYHFTIEDMNFVFVSKDFNRLTEEHMSTLHDLLHVESLYNPIYVSIEPDGVLLVD